MDGGLDGFRTARCFDDNVRTVVLGLFENGCQQLIISAAFPRRAPAKASRSSLRSTITRAPRSLAISRRVRPIDPRHGMSVFAGLHFPAPKAGVVNGSANEAVTGSSPSGTE